MSVDDGVIEVVVDEPRADAVRRLIDAELDRFNHARVGPEPDRDLILFARRGADVLGGLAGGTHWHWLHVSLLWVAEPARGRGLGRRLLRAAEAEAARRGCTEAHLDTFSFQALSFYEKSGYRVFGRLENYPPGHARCFLHKSGLSA